jgi:hypothetical protein
MKKILFLFVVLASFSVSLSAQLNLLPKFNARWDYQFTYLNGSRPPGQGNPPSYITTYSTYQNQGDSLFNGKVNYSLGGNLYFIEDSNRVFLGSLSNKKLFMDFNLNVNDSFKLYVNTSICQTGVVDFTVTQKDSVLMGGRMRKQMVLRSNTSCRPSKALRWIEGLGDFNHGGIRPDYTADCISTNDTRLNCFYDNGVSVYSLSCSVTGTSELETNSFQLFPNPTRNELKVKGEFKKLDYRIFSIQGKLVLTGTLFQNQQISLEQLKSGLYTIQLDLGNEFYTQKLVKE